MRTLALVDAYKKSDYGDQLQSDQYNLFREVLKSEGIRTWLAWDHTRHVAGNQPNLDRLFSWMSREVETDDGDENDEDIDIRSSPDPVITTGLHVRELGKIIADPEAVKSLEVTRSLQQATLSSDLLVRSEIEGAFKSCDRGIHKLNSRISDLESGELDKVEQLIGRLHGVMLARKRQPSTAGARLPWQPFNEITQSRFSSISVERYRGISGLTLENLGQVNLIVGLNNAGKTSLLEAIYLLAHQNDERALLDAIRWRGRMEGDPPPLWLVEQLPESASISGCFGDIPENTTNVEFRIKTEPEPDIEDQTSFLSALTIDSRYGHHEQNTDVVFFGDRPRRTNFQGQHWLCRSIFTSPFSANRPETLARSNKDSLELGSKQDIIRFITELGTHGDCKWVDKLISNLPSPFGPGGVAKRGLIAQRIEQHALGDLSVRTAQHPPLPSFESIVENLATDTMFFLVRTHGQDRSSDTLKLLEDLNTTTTNVSTGTFDVSEYAVAFLFDANGEGVDATLASFGDRYRIHFGDLGSLEHGKWMEGTVVPVG